MHAGVWCRIKEFGSAKVLEVLDDHDGDACRASYTVTFGEAVSVLHAFQKKSKQGIKASRRDIDLISKRLKSVEQMLRRSSPSHLRPGAEPTMNAETTFVRSSGNVFADLDLPNPETRIVKAQLARVVGQIIRREGWTQAQAAEILGIDQPRVSKLVGGRLSEFSVDRLLGFLVRADLDVQIGISSADAGAPARMTVHESAEFHQSVG